MYCTLVPGFLLGIRPRLSSPSSHARAGEALPDIRAIIVVSRGCVHEFVIHLGGNVKEFVHAAIRELQFEGSTTICIFMVADFGDALRGNRDPIHLLRAPVRCRDSSRGRFWGPSGHSLRLYPSVRPNLPGL